MLNYLNDKDKESKSHYFIDMRFLLTDLQKHYASTHGAVGDDDGSVFFINS